MYELGFVINADEAVLLGDGDYQGALAGALADGILEHLTIKAAGERDLRARRLAAGHYELILPYCALGN